MVSASPVQDRPRGDVLFFASANRVCAAIITLVCIALPFFVGASARLWTLVEAGYGLPAPWFDAPLGAFSILWPALIAAPIGVSFVQCAVALARLGGEGGYVAGIDDRALYTRSRGRTRAIDRSDILWIGHLPGFAIVAHRRRLPTGPSCRLSLVPTALIAGGDQCAHRDFRAAFSR
ncbi:MAG: hypothetical protein ACTSSQ_01600 [Alphaproteobacteria bacterium]